MTEFEPVPEQTETRWQTGMDTFDRVYETLCGTTTPTPYTEIADRADCSPNAAKKHLDRLVEIGVAAGEREVKPARYERHPGYFEWQEAQRIASAHTPAEIINRIGELTEERTNYENQFGTTDPATLSVVADEQRVHERLEALGEWHAIIRDIRLYELAYQLAQNDGQVIRR